MKLPRYLQVILALTAALCLWSGLKGDDAADEDLLMPARHSAEITGKPPASEAVTEISDNGQNLFPFQGKVEPPVAAKPVQAPVAATPRAPQLPFIVAGAWWSHNQRLLVLSDGRQSWIVCRACKVKESVRPGQQLDSKWQLMEVEDDHLTIRWLPLNNDQQLALGDLKSKPEF